MTTVLISADSRYPIERRKIKKAIEELLREKRVTSEVEVSVLVCGRRKSQELAVKYLGDDKAHNVLSFPLIDESRSVVFSTGKNVRGFVENPEEKLILGDIVICYPLVQEEANRDDVLVSEKIGELVKHGLRHLLGEHHSE